MNTPAAIGSRKDGFTLVELLMVLSIMAVISTFAVTAMNTMGNSSRLDSGGRLVSNLVTIARSEAINQRTLVQLRIVTTNQGGSDDLAAHYRKMSLWKLDQSQAQPTYVQFTPWETLPAGIIIDPSSDPATSASPAYAFATTPGTYFLNSGALNNSSSSGNGVTVGNGTYNYTWIEFSPTGSTTFPAGYSTTYLLLTEGFIPSQSGSPIYTHNRHANWFQVSINSLTGTSKVVRP